MEYPLLEAIKKIEEKELVLPQPFEKEGKKLNLLRKDDVLQILQEFEVSLINHLEKMKS